MNSPVLTVTQLNTYIKSLIDGDFNLSRVFVCGEISNFTNHYRTGHYYFTVKDTASSIKAVMFKTSNQRLKFMPENGMSVILRGRVSVFERDGQYQLYVDDMQPDGLGALNLAFEQMKNRLEKEGLFAPERKKPIPAYPMRVGVITSPTGAAVQDIINILSRRFPVAEMIFCPVQVQGESAAPQIASAIYRFNANRYADVLIVGRGGGSIEELWAFNEEIVARAVADSDIPVISAVGHETDFTICDFVADLRAPTPSAAAELAVPDAAEERQMIFAELYRMRSLVEGEIKSRREYLNTVSGSGSLLNPLIYIDNGRQLVDKLISQADLYVKSGVERARGDLANLCGRLDALSPLKVLSRGYAIAMNKGKVVDSTDNVKENDELKIKVSNGTVLCTVNGVENNG
ncbi:MAG: exodeoxyribonuclease VII large subunit [Clostridiales bacterium]|nr:exodeoxyribonuclease VII large subunit [Clostridiales bacterium]